MNYKCVLFLKKKYFCTLLLTLVYLKHLKGFMSIAQSIYKKLYVLKQNERTGLSSISALFSESKASNHEYTGSYL